MKKFFMSFFSTIIICMLIIACSDDDSSTGPGAAGSYKNATISHWGFDFSEAINDTTNWGENNDGETISWTPIGESSDKGIWFRTRVYPNRTQSLGLVDITSISTIDTSATAWDTNPPALSKNDVVIAQCLDGFVKFQVTAAVDTSLENDDWAVQVRYLFSTVPSFNE